MPLTDELGNEVLDALPHKPRRAPKKFKDGYFEAWLSRLAEPQPDLEDHINQENYGLFLLITKLINQIMLEREGDVLNDSPPWWLLRLIGLLHATKSTVLTFNYDTLIERTIDLVRLEDWERRHIARQADVVRRMPPSPPMQGLQFAAPEADTLRLLKLHGSLDCYWVSGDSSGATINRWEVGGTWGSPPVFDARKRRQVLPGREPFIVPPAAAKSVFYNNPVTRELWRSSAEALSSARRVALIGYSMPPTDLVTSGMLASSRVGRPVHIDVVNPDPDQVAERLVRVGVPARSVHKHGGSKAVEEYVDRFEREVALTIRRGLDDRPPSELLMIATSQDTAARVIDLAKTSDGVDLLTEPITTAMLTTAVARDGSQLPQVSLAQLLNLLGPERTLRVRYASGNAASVVSCASWRTDTGLGDGKWTVLVPSAMEQ